METKFLSAAAVYGENHPDLVKMRREMEALRKEVGISHRSMKELRQQLVGLKGKLAETREKYTTDHPDVIKLQKQIQEIEANLVVANDDKSEQNETADNPAYIELRSRLDSTNADLKSLYEHKRQYKNKLADYENRIVNTPKIERTYVALTRDYKNAVAKYQDMVAKQTSAKLAEELEKNSKGERFSLIEPPLTPEKPFKPNRSALILLGLILAVGAGFGVMMLQENLDKSIHGEAGLQKIFGEMPLARIPYIVTDTERHKRKRRLQYSLGAAVASAIIAIAMVDQLFMPLDVLLFTVMRKLGIIG